MELKRVSPDTHTVSCTHADRRCFVCLCDDTETEEDVTASNTAQPVLPTPCACTDRYAHPACLARMVVSRATTQCPVCRVPYTGMHVQRRLTPCSCQTTEHTSLSMSTH